jgi:hypothetical protein
MSPYTYCWTIRLHHTMVHEIHGGFVGSILLGMMVHNSTQQGFKQTLFSERPAVCNARPLCTVKKERDRLDQSPTASHVDESNMQ